MKTCIIDLELPSEFNSPAVRRSAVTFGRIIQVGVDVINGDRVWWPFLTGQWYMFV